MIILGDAADITIHVQGICDFGVLGKNLSRVRLEEARNTIRTGVPPPPPTTTRQIAERPSYPT